MVTLSVLLALLATTRSARAQFDAYNPSCTAGLTYTAPAITRTFDYCTGFAYGLTFSYPSNPYPTNSANCVNSCTGSCVAANWAIGNNCQLAMGSLQFIYTMAIWNPTWTAYVARAAAPETSTTLSRTLTLVSSTRVSSSTLSTATITALLMTSRSTISASFSTIATPSSSSSSSSRATALLATLSPTPFIFPQPWTTTSTRISSSSSIAHTSSIPSPSSSIAPTSSIPLPSSSNAINTSIVTSTTATTATLNSTIDSSHAIIIPEPPTASCPDGNGTTYINALGSQFALHCGFDLHDTDPELQTLQPDFQSCIDDCDRRFAGKCSGVTWSSEEQWCYVKPYTASLQPALGTLWSAVKLAGPEGLTCPEANGTVYTNAVYTDLLVDRYSIYCGFELVDPAVAKRSLQVSFQACINDCHQDEDCDGVTWRPNGEDQPWCYHKSRSAVVKVSGANYWSAQRIFAVGTEDNGTTTAGQSFTGEVVSSSIASSLSSSSSTASQLSVALLPSFPNLFLFGKVSSVAIPPLTQTGPLRPSGTAVAASKPVLHEALAA